MNLSKELIMKNIALDNVAKYEANKIFFERFVNMILIEAIKTKAGEIHFERNESEFVINFVTNKKNT